MKRALVALFTVAVVAGAWMFSDRPSPSPSPSPPPATTREQATNAPGPPAHAPPPPALPDAVAPPPAAAAPVPAPGSPEAAAEGARLREEGLRLRARIKVEEALAVLKQAVAVDPSAENHAAYGRLLRDLTVIDKALYHLRAAAEADPRNADRWIELANAYYLKPDPGLAWQAEKRAREAEPGLQLRRTRGQLERADDSTAPAQ